MKWINAEQQVTLTIYDEEHEEYLDKTMTVEEALDAYTNEGCPTIFFNPEQKTGKWYEDEEVGLCRCDQCQAVNLIHTPFCPMCGARMVGEEE